MKATNFGNGRYVRNTFDKILIKHSTNTKNSDDMEDLITITENDIASDAALNTVNDKIDAFLNAAEIGDAAVDTLKEIQDYIDTHGEAAAQMVADIADNKSAISALTQTVIDNKNTLDGKDSELAQAIANKQDKLIDNTYTAVTYPTIEGVIFKDVKSNDDIQTAIHKVDDNVASLASGLSTEISNKQNKKIDENYLNVNYPTVGESQFLSVKSNMTIQNAINVVDNNVAQLATEVTKIPLPLDVTSLISGDLMEITFTDLAASNLYCSLEEGVVWEKGEMIGDWEDYVIITDGSKQYYFINKAKGVEVIFKVWVDSKGVFMREQCETIPTEAIELTQSFCVYSTDGWAFYNMSGYKYNVTPVKYVGECTTGELLGGFLIVETMSILETTTSVYHITETNRDYRYGLMVDKDNSFEYVSNTYAIMKMKQDAYDEVTKNDKTLYVIEEE